jgi:hypothetical protein
VRRTVPPSAEIEEQIDRLLAVGVGENPRESLSELAKRTKSTAPRRNRPLKLMSGDGVMRLQRENQFEGLVDGALFVGGEPVHARSRRRGG